MKDAKFNEFAAKIEAHFRKYAPDCAQYLDVRMEDLRAGSRAYIGFQKQGEGAYSNERCVANITLHIGHTGVLPRKDEEGNLFVQYRLFVETSWPSWGAAHPDLNAQRLALMLAVNLLAREMLTEFSQPIECLYKTRAEIALEEAEAAAVKLISDLRTAIAPVVKGMQKHTARRQEIPHGFPTGEYKVSLGHRSGDVKEYSVTIQDSSGYTVTRTK
jgi:hypothetical protein